MEWKVWPDKGFCVLGDLTVYVQFDPTSSGAVRVIGPFAPSSLHREKVENLMRHLTIKLESEFLRESEYVLWGAYCDEPDYQEHAISILGTLCGHIPFPWVRTRLLGLNAEAVHREWVIRSDRVTHKSGVLSASPNSFLDSAVVHPTRLELDFNQLKRFAELIAGKFSIPKSTSLTKLPLEGWTALNKRAIA